LPAVNGRCFVVVVEIGEEFFEVDECVGISDEEADGDGEGGKPCGFSFEKSGGTVGVWRHGVGEGEGNRGGETVVFRCRCETYGETSKKRNPVAWRARYGVGEGERKEDREGEREVGGQVDLVRDETGGGGEEPGERAGGEKPEGIRDHFECQNDRAGEQAEVKNPHQRKADAEEHFIAFFFAGEEERGAESHRGDAGKKVAGVGVERGFVEVFRVERGAIFDEQATESHGIRV